MIGIPPSEAALLDLWEYEALLVHWNRAHSTEADDGEMPSPERAQATLRRLDAINGDPRLTH